MKNFSSRLMLAVSFVLVAYMQQANAQSITALAPSSAIASQTIDVVVRAINTSFRNGITQIQMPGGSGIEVKHVNVQDAQTAIITLQIAPDASIGDRDIIVSTGNEVVRLDNAFQIFTAGSELKANIQALPLSAISLSDFDVNNPTQVPLIFFCNIYNDNHPRKVRVYVFFSTASRGLIGYVNTDQLQLEALKYYKLTNSGFTNFKSNGDAGDDFLKAIREKGGLPADEYSYKLEVRDMSNHVLASDETVNVVSNPTSNPDLIAPGNLFSEELEKVYAPQPFFQWFGNNAQYDFALYELKDGRTEQEVTRGVPVYKQGNITGKNLLYPAYAEKLREGATYVWFVKGKYAGSKGIQYLPSQKFRFMFGNPPLNTGSATVSKIFITPQEIELKAGQTFQFNVQMLDEDNKLITNIQPTFKLTPAKATITKDGLLTAGSEAGDIAVLVKAGNASDFATVKIKVATSPTPTGEEWLIDKMIRKVFGIPGK